MSAVQITFLGGAECGDVGKTTWGNDATGRIDFPLNRAVVVDPDAPGNGPDKTFLMHLIKKARVNPFFKVENASGQAGAPAKVEKPAPREPVRSARKQKAAA